MSAETYQPSELVLRALEDLGIRPTTDRNETAWAVAIEWPHDDWFSEYERAAMKRLALSILAGDDESAETAALWIVDPDEAMERALAAIRQPKTPTLADVIAAWRTSGLSSRLADDLARYAAMNEDTARAFLTGVVRASLEDAEACPDSVRVTERAEAVRVSRTYLGGAL